MKLLTAIGGLGGSGTRVVAELLIESGIFLGRDLNKYFDNLLFTRLLKNPDWYSTVSKKEISQRFEIFRKIMSGQNLEDEEYFELKYACKTNAHIKTRWFNRLTRKPNSNAQLWGWKEPNTHIYLDHIASLFPDIKYIHVIRDSSYMANSTNTQQLNIWGNQIFDMNLTEESERNSVAQLKYWIKANQRAINLGSTQLSGRFYVCNYTRLCDNPKLEIKSLLSFLDLEVTNKTMSSLLTIPKRAYGKNHNKVDLSGFSDQQILEIALINQLSGKL